MLRVRSVQFLPAFARSASTTARSVRIDDIDVAGALGDAFFEDSGPLVHHGAEDSPQDLHIVDRLARNAGLARCRLDHEFDRRIGKGFASFVVIVAAPGHRARLHLGLANLGARDKGFATADEDQRLDVRILRGAVDGVHQSFPHVQTEHVDWRVADCRNGDVLLL